MQQDSGILKFVSMGQTSPTKVGLRTFPHQTFGVSKESPEHFQRRHTFVSEHGYLYQHENAPEFEYHSQHKSTLDASPSKQGKGADSAQHHPLNPYRFHLKKGRMTEFLDKNGWMSTVYVMTGQERSKRSRQTNNYDRSMRLNASKRPIGYDSGLTYKSQTRNQHSLQTIADTMSEKVRIRNRRNQEARRQSSLHQRQLPDLAGSSIEIDDVRAKMSKTSKAWCDRLKKDKLNHQFPDKKGPLSQLETDGMTGGQLQEWQRKTCKSKWSFKPTLTENQEDEQYQNESRVKSNQLTCCPLE